MFGLNDWDNDVLEAAGKDAIAFITHVSPRGLPEDWRLHTAYVTARYSDGTHAPPNAIIRPSRLAARSRNGLAGGNPGSEATQHTWLLPETMLRTLTQLRAPKVDVDYASVILEPMTARIPVDGKRRSLPRIGSCSAVKETLHNRIRVDCFGAGIQPALLSAELDGIAATRVDSRLIELAPTFIRLLKTQRVQLDIASPDLSESNTIKVTGYFPARFATLRTSTDGMLGGSADTCPLPMPGVNRTPPVSSWNDRSPHERRSIVVGENVQLEVLDWGGTGRTLVMLHGLGATAHSFDDLAPLLAKKFRVIGITRRGIGYSSRPDRGYGQARLVQDVIDVLDALRIDKAVFVGHSIAGDELTMLGGKHPQRVDGLIYLDAAYDRSGKMSARYRELNESLPDVPQPHPEELQSYATMLRYIERIGSTPIPEGELIAMRNMGHPYLAGQITIDSRFIQAIEAAIGKPDYAAVRAPALSMYATTAGPDALLKPWHDANDPALRATLRELQRARDAIQRREIDRFRSEVRHGRVLELPGASHWIFGPPHQQEVLDAIVDFVTKLPASGTDSESSG
jgi:pimeloyl-ACP methyl ester carboxylesterase